jgi:flagellar hook protein FlgE
LKFVEQTPKRGTFRIASPAMVTANSSTANGDFQLVGRKILVNAEGAMVRGLNSRFSDSGLLTEQFIEDCCQF